MIVMRNLVIEERCALDVVELLLKSCFVESLGVLEQRHLGLVVFRPVQPLAQLIIELQSVIIAFYRKKIILSPQRLLVRITRNIFKDLSLFLDSKIQYSTLGHIISSRLPLALAVKSMAILL